MRVRHFAARAILPAALTVPLLLGTAACGEVQEAQQGIEQAQQNIEDVQRNLDIAQQCAKAIGLVNFMPDFSSPEQARAEARQKAAEIGKLAEQTADDALKQGLLDVQQSLERVASGEITIDNSAQWMQRKLEEVQQVLSACSELTG